MSGLVNYIESNIILGDLMKYYLHSRLTCPASTASIMSSMFKYMTKQTMSVRLI